MEKVFPKEIFQSNCPKIIVKENKILKIKSTDGITIDGKEIDGKIVAKIIIKEGFKLDIPINLCFGISKDKIDQIIDMEIILEDNSEITILSHCSFPKAKNIKHIMNGRITVGKNSKLIYKEVHFHGNEGNILVKPTTKVTVKEKGVYFYELTLTEGRIGTLEVNTHIDVEKNGVADITTKTYAVKNDRVTINETVKLNGSGGKSIIKSRGAARDNSTIKLNLKIEGNAPNCRGHIDCTEIVEGNAVVESVPIVIVRNEKARITHEAAIGSVDKKQLETLMVKGLNEEEAIDVIVKGMIS